MKNIFPTWSNLVFTQLISYGVQLGHSIENSLAFCAWMIKGKRQSIFLIDLFKFNYMLRAGLFALEVAVRGRKPVWFVNLEKTSSLFVKFPALECGEYWSTENWIKGMISNYFTIKKSFLKNVTRSFAVWNRKFFLKNSNFAHWGFTRYTWPRFIFVSNVLKSYGPCHEAHRLGIPALGVVDTDTPHNLVSIAVPGNDESASSLIFYNSFISTFVIYIKYSFVHSWYMSCLNENKFSFENWWKSGLASRATTIKPNNLLLNFDQLRYMVKGFESQFLQDSWQSRKLENIVYNYNKKNLVVSQLSLRLFYGKKVKLLRALTKSWVLSSFLLKFLKPNLRKILRAGKSKKYQSKYSLTKNKNTHFFLMPFRLSERLFYKKISRRLSKIKIASRAKNFFYKFYSLGALFALFRNVPVFTRRMVKKISFKSFYHRGGVKFSNYKRENFLAPFSYRRIFPRYIPGRRNKRSLNPEFPFYRTSTYPTKGFNRSVFQFSANWFKSIFLLRYCFSLGMPTAKLGRLSSDTHSLSYEDNFLGTNLYLNGFSKNSLTNVAKDSNRHGEQVLNIYKNTNVVCTKNSNYSKWFVNGKLRLRYLPSVHPWKLNKLLKCYTLAGQKKVLKYIYYIYV